MIDHQEKYAGKRRIAVVERHPWVFMLLALAFSVQGFHLAMTTKVNQHDPLVKRNLMSYARVSGWAAGLGDLLAFLNLFLTKILGR